MIELEIEDNRIKEAELHAEERLEYEYDRFGLSDKQRKSMIIIGTIGQLKFKDFLDSRRIDYEFEYQAGEYDNFDFKLKLKYKDLLLTEDKVDIKCSGYDIKNGFDRRNLLYSKDQFKSGLNKDYKYCVQSFINGYNHDNHLLDTSKCNKYTIAGFIPFEVIGLYKNYHKNYWGDDFKVPLKKLEDINELIRRYEYK